MEQKRRVCLRCDKEFFSESRGNRICGECKKSNCKVFMLQEIPWVSRRRGGTATE